MNEFLDSLSNREISITIWSILLFCGLLILGKSFKSFGSVIKSFFAKQLIPHYVVICGYIALIFYLIKQTILWEKNLFKDFIIWCVAFAFYSFFTTNKIQTNKDLFKYFWKIFSLTIFVDFFLNYFTFSLGWELVIIPFITFIGVLQFYTEYHIERNGYLRVNNILKFILSISGFTFLIYCIYQLLIGYREILSNNSLKAFILPVILSVLFFPIITFYSALIKIENIFIEVNRYRFITNNRKRKIKLAILIFGNFNLDKLSRIRKWDKKEIQSSEDILNYIRKL